MANMYVCMCSDVNDSEVKEAIEAGADTVDKLASALGVSTGCGACEDMVKEILTDCLDRVLPLKVIDK